jgi:hypothetical protein
MAKGTIRGIHAILSGAFEPAMRWDWIDLNPAASARPPTSSRPSGFPASPCAGLGDGGINDGAPVRQRSPGRDDPSVDATGHAAKDPCLREQLHAIAGQELSLVSIRRSGSDAIKIPDHLRTHANGRHERAEVTD